MVENNNNGNGARRSRVARRKNQEANTPKEAATATPVVKETKPEKKTASKEKRASKRTKKKKKKHVLLKILAALVCLGLVCCIAGGIYVANIIKNTPDIETDDIGSLLSQTSSIYDSNGKLIEKIYGDKDRTLVSLKNIPEHTQNAFIALEDKTFRTHHGFNIIRIFGAITQKLLHGGDIGGTSTLTQQLARNLYLEDTMSERSLDRKIKEAYYAYLLEERLSKDEIMEAYLNTVNFGSGFGVQSAAKSYFNKSVKKLTIAESAALASLVNAPSYYALVVTIPTKDLTDEFKDKVLYTSGEYSICYNDRVEGRMKICLDFMLEQGLITQKQHDKAVKVKVKDMVHPSKSKSNNVTSYFADFVIESVIDDFEASGMDRDKAIDIVYNKGVKIYTTLDPQAQSVIDKEFKDPTNFPFPAYYSTDYEGNIITSTGKIMLYKYDNFIQDGAFTLKDGEYKIKDNGNIVLYGGNRLRFYETSVNGEPGVSIELPKLFRWKDDGYFYITDGAFVNIPEGYARLTKKGNVIVNAKLREDYPDVLKKNDAGYLYTKDLTLKATNIQPQCAMTIIDNKTGAVVAMSGGRGSKGKMLFNRATGTRQPGSSIKPISVYSAALQKSFEQCAAGQPFGFVETGYDKQGTKMWGQYITAASIVVDERMTVNGKEWPKNANNAYTGKQTLRTALQQSINTCAVKILSQVGIDYAYEHAKKFGLTTLVDEGSATDTNLAALGIGGLTHGVSTLEMASAYSTFVNDGIHKSYYCYDKVTDRKGKTILEPTKTETEVLDPGVAWIMRDILQTVVSQGIAGNARIYGEVVGGKTGTTGSQRENTDIWFDGFTANYSAALWIGSDVNIGLSEQSPKAALLWSRIMSQIDKAKGGVYSGRPSNVVVANVNGRSEYFTAGTEKKAGAGGKFVKVKICKDTGLLATPECPHTETINGFQADKEKDEKMGNIPTTYCYKHNPDLKKYKVSDKHRKEAEKIIKEKEEEEKKKKEEAEKKKKEEEKKKKEAEKKKKEEEKKKAEEKAKKDAEKKAKEEAAKKQKAYEQWLADRVKHRKWIIDVPGKDAVLYTQEDFDKYVEEHDGQEPEDWTVGSVKEEAVEEQGHWQYEKGWRDGDFKYP